MTDRELMVMAIDAFMVSSNCDTTSPKSIYTSYLKRKKEVIDGKMNALKKGNVVNKNKLSKHKRLYDLFSKNGGLAISVIKERFENSGYEFEGVEELVVLTKSEYESLVGGQ